MQARTPRNLSTGAGEGQNQTGGEVYFEFIVVGNSVKVSAIDAASGVEVAIIGPKATSQEQLKRIALRKLQNKLQP